MALDPAQLIHTGAIEGPFRRTHPLTLTWRTRFVRWVRSIRSIKP